MATKAQMAERAEAIAKLQELLKPGMTVYTILRHVSSSGMSRAISAVIVDRDGTTFTLDYLIARAGLFPMHSKHAGLNVGGAGMDMGFHVVYSLSRTVFPKGFKCTGHDGTKRAKRCPSNDHSNYYAETRGQDNPEPNYKRGKHHKDGGYALRQEWL